LLIGSKTGIRFKIVIPFFLIIIVSASINKYTAEGASSLSLGTLNVQDSTANEASKLLINSRFSFSISLSNNNQSYQPYVVIFDVRDSDDTSILIEFEKGIAEKYTTTFEHSEWIPDKTGTYTVRTFAISDLHTPEILSPVVSRQVEVVAQQPESNSQGQPVSEPSPSVINGTSPGPTLDDLKQYALEKINEDREKFGLSPVKLSDNAAAQIHVEDIFTTRHLSHWMSNGEKPYMTYTRLGGMGYVSQNAGYVGHAEDYIKCVTGELDCIKVNPLEAIEQLQYDMIYNDSQSSWRNNNNILNKYHTHVSIGIAYDDYFFAFVQNFENIYIAKEYETDYRPVITIDDTQLEIEGKITDGQFSPALGHALAITIFYDPLSTADEYQKHKDDKGYNNGRYVACILQVQGPWYCPDVMSETAHVWHYVDRPEYDSFLIKASLDRILKEPGVYTVILTAEPVDAKEYDEWWRVASYSIWYDQP
jgi:uncharacterized protein YkwD